MRSVLFILLSIFLVNCSSKDQVKFIRNITMTNDFKDESSIIYGAVESSIVINNNKLTYLFDYGMNGNLSILDNGYIEQLLNNARFSYIFKNNDTYYMFYTINNSIFLSKSYDLEFWIKINNGKPVLNSKENSNYKNIWNVGVTIDNNNVWHLLVEASADGNENAGLIYSYAELENDNIDFNKNINNNFIIEKAGNPWVQYIDGKGLLTVYGKMNNGTWEVRAAIFSNGAWKESENFYVGAKDIAICDPHLIEFENKIYMTVSYDQVEVRQIVADKTLSQLFDEILYE